MSQFGRDFKPSCLVFKNMILNSPVRSWRLPRSVDGRLSISFWRILYHHLSPESLPAGYRPLLFFAKLPDSARLSSRCFPRCLRDCQTNELLDDLGFLDYSRPPLSQSFAPSAVFTSTYYVYIYFKPERYMLLNKNRYLNSKNSNQFLPDLPHKCQVASFKTYSILCYSGPTAKLRFSTNRHFLAAYSNRYSFWYRYDL